MNELLETTTDSTFGFERTLTFGDTTLFIHLKRRSFAHNGNTYWFGAPLGNLSESDLSTPGGYFLKVSITPEECRIANDITGGYRVYQYRFGSELHISDDYEYLMTLMRLHEPLQLHPQELTYWKKHRYTTGGTTFIHKLNKLPPASTLCITRNGIEESCYFADEPSAPDSRTHTELTLNSLTTTITQAVSSGREPILFFSGGVDSTLLALLLQQNGCRFRSVLCAPSPLYAEAHADICRARQVGKYLGLKLEEIPLSLNITRDIMQAITREMLFDRHFSIIHFTAMQYLSRTYGTDLTIISGQAADSIFTYGPSQNRPGDLAARALLFSPQSPLGILAAAMVRAKHGKRYRRPKREESDLAFFDQHEYYTMVDMEADPAYHQYLAGLLAPIKARFANAEAYRMYLKIYGFLQGSDNQVVIRSARSVGVEQVVLPYAAPQIISATIRYREPRRELFFPKYVVHNILKQLGYKQPPVAVPSRTDLVSLTEISQIIDSAFDRTLREVGN